MFLAFLTTLGFFFQTPIKTIGAPTKIQHPKLQIVSVSQQNQQGVLTIMVEAAEEKPFDSLNRIIVVVTDEDGAELVRLELDRSSKDAGNPQGFFRLSEHPERLAADEDKPKRSSTKSPRLLETPHGKRLDGSHAENHNGLLRAVFHVKPRRWQVPDCLIRVKAQALAKDETDSRWIDFRQPVQLTLETWRDQVIDTETLQRILDGCPTAAELARELSSWEAVSVVSFRAVDGLNPKRNPRSKTIPKPGADPQKKASTLAYTVRCHIYPTTCGAQGGFPGDLLPGSQTISLGDQGTYWRGDPPCFIEPPNADYRFAQGIVFVRNKIVCYVTQFAKSGQAKDRIASATRLHDLRALASLIDQAIESDTSPPPPPGPDPNAKKERIP